jgi:hypothetical protein
MGHLSRLLADFAVRVWRRGASPGTGGSKRPDYTCARNHPTTAVIMTIEPARGVSRFAMICAADKELGDGSSAR